MPAFTRLAQLTWNTPQQTGIALVEGATGGRSSRKGGDEKLRLCLKAIRCICASSMQIHNASQTLTARSLGSSAAGAAVNSGSPDASERFAEEAFELSLGVVEGEWTGDAGREGGGVRAGDEVGVDLRIRVSTFGIIVRLFVGLERP